MGVAKMLDGLFEYGVDVGSLLERLTAVASHLHRSGNLDAALDMTTREARALLRSDRVVVYRFLLGGDGVVLSESVDSHWISIRGQQIYDPCFETKWHLLYQQGKVSVIDDVEANPLSACYLELLTRLQVRANLVVPIILNPGEQSSPQLWGLLIAHQCRSARQWSSLDIHILQHLAMQLGVVIQSLDVVLRLPPKLQPPPHIQGYNFENSSQTSKSGSFQSYQPLICQPLEVAYIGNEVIHLKAFDLLQTPVWIYDIERLQMRWANRASLYLWNAASREELICRNFSDVSEATRIRLQAYLHQFQQGKTRSEQWTFYPGGRPVSVQCRCSGIQIDQGRLAMLVEGTFETTHQIEQESLRSIEALRHTTVMISLYSLGGIPLMQNPAALRCYGDSLPSDEATDNAFLRHFVDAELGRQAIAFVESGQVFSTEAQVQTLKGIRWHRMDIRRTTDPVTGSPMLLVNEKDITDYKRAEADLATQQAFLRQIIDTIPSSVYVKDKQGRLLNVNQACSDMHGIPIEAMLGKREPEFNSAFTVEQLEQFLAVNRQSMAGHQPQKQIQQIPTATGELRWYQTVIRPWIDLNNQVQGVIGNSVDITELKQVEAALQQEAQRLATIITVQQDIAVSNPNLNKVMALIIEYTQQLTHASGAVIALVEEDDLVYRATNGIAAEFIGFRLQSTTSLSWQCLLTGQILQCDDVEADSRVDLATCRRIGIRSMVVAPLLAPGQCLGVLKVLSDTPAAFTAQDVQTLQLMTGLLAASIQLSAEFDAKNALFAALQESEDRYRSVVNVLTEGIVLQQANGQITACNESAERILGLTTDQIMGRTSLDPRWRAVHEDFSPFPGDTHPAMVALRTGQPQFNVVMGVYKPEGALTWISVNSQPLFHAGQSQPYATVTSFADITLYKQAEDILKHQSERERMVHAIAQHIRQSLDLDIILNTTVMEVRQFLQCDRVLIYRFNPDWSGIVIAESVASEWQSILNIKITDSYFVERQGKEYQDKLVRATSDIYTAQFSPCHVEFLVQLQVRAKLVVPIFEGDILWGLLVAHQCSSTREWQVLESELLMQLATQVSIAIQQSELYHRLQVANNELEQLATVDGLTQVANRRYFDQRLNQEWERLNQGKQPLSLLLIDVDYFKLYNDTYGHQAGDDCLRQLATAIKQVVKHAGDLVARYGGEEFVVLLPHTTTAGAVHVAHTIRTAVQKLSMVHAKSSVSSHITLSIGIATTIPRSQELPETLITNADQALYQAKRQGRNTYEVYLGDFHETNHSD